MAETGTSIFDPVLCEICYKWFNVKNGNMDSSQEFNLNSELLNRILILLQKYYHPFDISKFYGNYFFFNGESESSIKIQNKQISKENNKSR